MDQSSSSTANSYADYQAMVIQVSSALEALESLCGDLSLEENRRELEKCRKKLLDHTFTVGVMGEFKRGKSTVINALLGKELMPADILPCSATMNRVTFGLNPRVELRMRDGSSQQIPAEALSDYVTKLTKEKESRASQVEEAVVYYPCRFCQNGVDIVDTPGLNDDARMNQICETIIPKLDVVIMVLTPDNPFSVSEADFVRSKLVTGNVSRLIFVVNKIDQVRKASDRPRVVEAIRQKIQASVLEKASAVYGQDSEQYQAAAQKLGQIRIYPMSALDALDGHLEDDPDLVAESGAPEFEDALVQMLTRERGALALAVPLNAIDRICPEVLQAVENRREAMELTTQEYAQRQSAALEEIRQLRQEKLDQVQQLDASSLKAKAKLTQMVADFYPVLQNRLAEVVDIASQNVDLHTLGSESGREAAAQQLQNAVIKRMEQEMALITEQVQLQMQQILGQEAQRLGQFISQVAQRIQSFTFTNSKDSSFLSGGDLLGTGIGVLLGSVFYFAGGAFSGYKDAGLKGAVVGGSVSLAATYGVGMLVGTLVGGIPLILISAMAGTLTGKFVSKAIFSKTSALKKLDELKQQLYVGIHHMIQDMRNHRELERWAEKLVDDNFQGLLQAMDSECERLLRDTEANMAAIQETISANETQRQQIRQNCEEARNTLDQICQDLKPLTRKLTQDLEFSLT